MSRALLPAEARVWEESPAPSAAEAGRAPRAGGPCSTPAPDSAIQEREDHLQVSVNAPHTGF